VDVNTGQRAILNEVVQGAIYNPETYSGLYAIALEENEPSAMISALKEQYIKISTPKLLDLLEIIVFYYQFATDELLKKWIDLTKRFILGLEDKPEKKKEFVAYWKKRTEEELSLIGGYRTLDRAAFAVVCIQVTDYVNGS